MPALLNIGRRVLHKLRFVLFAAAALSLIAAAAYTSALIVERQRTLSGISRYNLTWAASQSVTELLRLEQAVADYALPDSDVDKDEVGIRLDVMANRVNVMRHGQLDDVVQETPELQAIVRDLAGAIDAARPMLERID